MNPHTSVSAGGVVLNTAGQVLLVNQDGLSWSLPKGQIETGETNQQAAKREIEEESGVTNLKYIKDLGTYQRFRIGLDVMVDDESELKTIVMFLFTTQQSALQPTDPTNPEARWVNIEDVEALLTHPKDKAFFKSIEHECRNIH